MLCRAKSLQKLQFDSITLGRHCVFWGFFCTSGLLLYINLNVIFFVNYLIEIIRSICWGSMRSIQFLTLLLLHSGSQGCSVLSQLPLGVKVEGGQQPGEVGSLPHKRQTGTRSHLARCLGLWTVGGSASARWRTCKLHAERVHGHRTGPATVNNEGALRALPLVNTLTVPFHAFSSIHLPLRPKQTEMPIKLNRQV